MTSSAGSNGLILPGLPPAFDGFTILQLSDLHVDMNEGAMRRLNELLPRLTYDLCALTGDWGNEEAAKKYSECPVSKVKGGDIGPFPYKFAVVEPFAKAAFSMKVGEISDVVATEFGYHIIKVAERSPGEASDFEKIKTEVKAIYAQEIYQSIITEQKRVAKIEMP